MKIVTFSNLKAILSTGVAVALLGTAVGCTTVTPGYDNHRIYFPEGNHHDNGSYKNNGRYQQGHYNNGRYANNRNRYNKNGHYKNNKNRYNSKNGQYNKNDRYNNGRYQNNHYRY